MTDQHDERFANRLREWAADYQIPPATPRDEMWQAIARRRTARREAPRRTGWVRWAVGIAATLAIGIALGRMTVSNGTESAEPGLASGSMDAPATNVAYDVATRDHVQRVETFLNVFRSEARAGRLDGSFGSTARLLAVQNRMLLTSPASEVPAVRQLLDDVDLVLMQIQLYDATGSSEDLGFIDDGIERRGVLLKLRALSSQGAT